MISSPDIFKKIFPKIELPPTLLDILSGLSFSEPDLLRASPSKLIPPFSLTGMKELLEKIDGDLSGGGTIRVKISDSGDSITAYSLLTQIFKKQRKRLQIAGRDNTPRPPLLDLSDPEKISYQAAEEMPKFHLPACSNSCRYALTGLVFKLGQAIELSREKGFGKQYVAFDLETTGKNPRSDEIIEIGAVKIKDGETGEEFNALVKPPRPISREISNLTGISNEDLKDAPSLQDVLPSFLDFIGDRILIAHNVDFDYPFLDYAMKKYLDRKLKNETYCTLVQARSRMPGQSHRLGAVAETLGIELKNWHRATADAKAAALIFLHFLEEDNSPKRYAYIRQHIARAALGTITAGVSLNGDNAVFFRSGLPEIIPAFIEGEKYYRKHPVREHRVDADFAQHLNSWRRKKRGQAFFRVLFNR